MTSDLHPLVASWFEARFGRPTGPQREAWPLIGAGRDVLVCAPTGSGKTLAAFLICIDRLVREGLQHGLPDEARVLYVSPLKALSADVQKNLSSPLEEIAAAARTQGLTCPPIAVALRTGDTSPQDRERFARRPAHILVTTPESFFILLTSERGRRALSTIQTVIVDEVHAVVGNKRGAHLALSLTRLDDLVQTTGRPAPQRVGLSATVRPIGTVAQFLAPWPGEGVASPTPRHVEVVDHGHARRLDLAVELPRDELGAVATNGIWEDVYDRLAALISAHRTTLVFVNTRRLAERLAHQLAQRLGEDAVLPHHGSLSRSLRLDAEQRLKSGALKAIVATASLELGIDVGAIDLVCQLGSPRALGAALQRIGRSGHFVDESVVPRGRLFATTRDELLECAAVVRAIRQGHLDRLLEPEWPLDVLAQQIVAMAACAPWAEDELYRRVRTAGPYRALPRREFDAIIQMLSEGIDTRRGRRGAFLHRDGVHRIVRGRRGARLAAITSGGAIPDNANYFVVAEPEGSIVGTVDEDFAVESLAGDVFLLGSTSWRIRRIESGRVRVEDAHGSSPTVPFWNGEAPGRTDELSGAVSEIRERTASAETAELAAAWLREACGLDEAAAGQLALYVRAATQALGTVPTLRSIVAERFFDEGGGMQLVLHAPLGVRINRAWGLSLRKRFCRSFNFELQAAATDNGIVISLSDQHSFPLEAVFRFLHADTVEAVLTQALLDAPMFTTRWRWNASRALAVPRFAGGRKVPPPLQRIRADDLLAAVFPDQVACAENLVGDIRIPDHPLVQETIRDCLHEAMDLDGLRTVLTAIETGAVQTRAIDTVQPSPFSHEILNANPYAFLDDAPLEERRARAVQVRRSLGPDLGDSGELGLLDPIAIDTVAAEVWPLVRDAEELHDALLTLIVLPPQEAWREWMAELVEAGRGTVLCTESQRELWVAAERLALVRLVYPGAGDVVGLSAALAGVLPAPPETTVDDAATEIIRGWLDSSGPVTASTLAEQLDIALPLVESALLRLEAEGQILRGRFGTDPGATSHGGWCNRRVLARIHRLTIGSLRREIAPVPAADYVRFLAHWQHVEPGTQLHGVEGTLQVLRQLQGYEVPAGAWEPSILARRVADYSPEWLDQLCLAGDVMWGRLTPHPAFPATRDADAPASTSGAGAGGRRSESFGRRPGAPGRRVRPSRVAPVTIFLREDREWLPMGAAPAEGYAMSAALSHAARDVQAALVTHGASFLTDLVRLTGRLTSEVEDGLWELAAAGVVTADGFDNLRSLVDPGRRRGQGRGRSRRPRHAGGRWALLPHDTVNPADGERVERFARQLLHRWGIVFRDLLARESLAPPWRDLLRVYRRLEARGKIRGGRFVGGFGGEQFAEPLAIEALRSIRRSSSEPPSLRVAAADPLNLLGIVLPGPRVSVLTAGQVEVRPSVDRSGRPYSPDTFSTGTARPGRSLIALPPG